MVEYLDGGNMNYVYAIYNSRTKEYVTSSGYYGNECNIRCFQSKDAAEKHLVSYYSNDYRPKRMKVKE